MEEGHAGLDESQQAQALARFYDLDVLDVSYDAELYLRLAHQAGGAVLELAVGSGRLAIPLALAGHRVLGVDHDAAMLERARDAWERARGPVERDRLSLHEADFMSFRCADRFSLAFIAVNTFLLAADDARDHPLQRLNDARGRLLQGEDRLCPRHQDQQERGRDQAGRGARGPRAPLWTAVDHISAVRGCTAR